MLLRERPRTSACGLPPTLAPLPSLTTAFSRRRAILGAASAVAVTGCAPAPAPYTPPPSAPKMPTSDARLVDLSATLEVLAARLAFALQDDEAWVDPSATSLAVRVSSLAEEIATTPAFTIDGLAAKVRALVNVTVPWEDHGNSRRLIDSVAADVFRFQAAGACFA